MFHEIIRSLSARINKLIVVLSATLLVSSIILIVPSVKILFYTPDSHKKVLTQIAQFQKALDKFRNDIGRYPTSKEGLTALRIRPEYLDSWNGPYLIKEIPVDRWGNSYIYNYPSIYSSEEYDIYSMGANSVDEQGEADDITSWTVVNLRYYDPYWVIRRGIFYLFIAIAVSVSIIIIRRGRTMGGTGSHLHS